MLELNARNGRWRLVNDWDALWSVPAETGVWTRFAFDVRYSQNPDVGSIKVFVDLNGDGDALDRRERSRTFHVATLRRGNRGRLAYRRYLPRRIDSVAPARRHLSRPLVSLQGL